MKLKYIINFAVIVLILNGINCKEKPTEPPVEEFPPGYQHDIPWPSLADSPWPMYRADPQNTGRAKFTTNFNGSIFKTYDSLYILRSGIIFDSDTSFVCLSYHRNSKIFNIGISGNINWGLAITNNLIRLFHSSGIVDNNGSIYYAGGSNGKVVAVDKNGNLNWSYQTDNFVYNNSLYLTVSGELIAISAAGTLYIFNKENGNIIFSNTYPELKDITVSMVLSPDSKTLYTNSKNNSIVAVDLITKDVKWKFGKKFIHGPIIINSFGEIYLISSRTNENEKSKLYCLYPDGTVKWSYEHQNEKFNNFPGPLPGACLDKFGNLYFGIDTVYSINYEGELNWKIPLTEGEIIDGIICDEIGNTFIVTSIRISSYDNKGNLLWKNDENIFSLTTAPSLFKDGILLPTHNSGIVYYLK